MIRVITAERTQRQGGEYWRVLLISEANLTKTQITGADVEGMNDDDKIDCGSICLVPGGKYIAYTPDAFTKV